MPDVNNTDFEVEDIVEQWGEYYLNNGQNMSNLHTLPMESFGTPEAGFMQETNDTVIREVNVRFGEVLQPYQHEFTDKGSVKMLPVNIFLHHMKIDLKILPNQLKGLWTDFLVLNTLEPTDYPIVAYIIEQYLFPQCQEDLEMSAIYKGVSKKPEEGVAGLAVDAMSGIETALTTMEADNKIEWINTGAWSATPATFVGQVEDFVKALPEKYKFNELLDLNFSRTLRQRFKEGMRSKYDINYKQTDNMLQLMDYENVTIKGRASQMNKNKVWATPKRNLGTFVKGFSNTKAFDVQKADRYVKFLSDWWVGTGFIQPEEIFANELT